MTFESELRKTIEAADIIIEVLDARNPIGSRSHQIEEAVLQKGKRLVLLLNKIDLVPKDNVKQWLAYLRKQLPTIAFKASTQEQKNKLGRFTSSNLHCESSKCIGADLVMKLLKNYCRNKDVKTTIRVGLVGFPNVGKSSVINSLKRRRSCSTGAVPGVTKRLQEVELDKNIRLIDSPGVVFASSNNSDPAEVALKNALRVDTLSNPVTPVMAILRRCSVETLVIHFKISHFTNPEQFLPLVARKLGRLKQGGVPDVDAAARHVLNDWNCGKLRYFTQVPSDFDASSHIISSEVVTTMAKEFDLDELDDDIKVLIDEMPEGEMNVDAPKKRPRNDDEAMEDDTPTESNPLNEDVVIQPRLKKKKPKIDPMSLQRMFDKTRDKDGNIRLGRVQKMHKLNRKKQRKLDRKVDNMTDLFTSMGQQTAKLEDQDDWFGFLKQEE
ncbi:CP-type G domain-containing protein [Aphelenchoides bicaudatus]|nr:CP-type G domain-containing protein [Aphelenchoides bicaudatus]